jgi:hypothetical protein
LRKASKRLAQAVGILATLRSHRHLDDRVGHINALQRAHTWAGGRTCRRWRIDTHHGHDVARLANVNLLALVGVHAHDSAEPLLAAGPLVEVHLAFFDGALVNAKERQLPVGIVDDLEGHADKRFVGLGA